MIDSSFGKKLVGRASFLALAIVSSSLPVAAGAASSLSRYTYYIADIDADGVDDYYAVSSLYIPIGGGGYTVLIPASGDAFAILGNADGSYSAAVSWNPDLDVSGFAQAQAYIYDFDGDGINDVFLHAQDASLNSLLLAQGEPDPQVVVQFTSIESVQISGNSAVSVSQSYGSPAAELNIDGQYIAELSAGNVFDLQDPLIDNGATGGLYAQSIAADLVGVSGPGVVVASAGQSSYRVDVAVPPGVSGFQPALALVYQSGARSGGVGAGWNLSGMPVISRCGQAPAYGDSAFTGVTFTSQDRLCLGGERLKIVDGAYWQDQSIYKPESNPALKVKQTLNGSEVAFELSYPDGRWLQFGHAFKPTSAAQPISWHVSEARDAFDNSMSYGYAVVGNENLLRYINYGNLGDAQVEFRYERRDDVRAAYVSGAKLEVTQALSAVRTSLNGSEVSEYRMIYGSAPYDATTGALLLKGVQRCGYEASVRACLPAVELDYESSSFGFNLGATSFPGVGTSYHSAVLDWNGDGIDDFVTSDNHNITLRTLSASGGATTSNIVSLTGSKVYALGVVDSNGDGKSEIAYLEGSISGSTWAASWRVVGEGASATTLHSFTVDISAETANIADPTRSPEPVAADVTGDGYQDLVVFSGSNWRIYKGGASLTYLASLPKSDLPLDKRPFAAKITSDGLVSLLYRGSESYTGFVTLNRNGSRKSSGGIGTFSGDKIVPVDINGDGLTDFVDGSGSTLAIHKATGTGGFDYTSTSISSAQVFPSVSGFEGLDKSRYFVRALDIDSNGESDLIYYNPSETSQYFGYLLSDGNTFSGPYASLVPSYLRPKVTTFQYLFEVENNSPAYDIMPKLAESLGLIYELSFSQLYVNYLTGELTGQVPEVSNGQITSWTDIEDRYPEGQDIDFLISLMDGFIQIWRDPDSSSLYPPYPSDWPVSLSSLNDVAEITESCELYQYAQCDFIRAGGFLVAQPTFAILEGYNFYATGTYSGNVVSNFSGHDLQLMDANGDGLTDIVTVNQADDGWLVYANTAGVPALASVTDSLGAVQEIHYTALPDAIVCDAAAPGIPAGTRAIMGGTRVVSGVDRDTGLRDGQGAPIMRQESYDYCAGAASNVGRGFLGFAGMRRQVADDEWAQTYYAQNYPHIGSMVSRSGYAVVDAQDVLVSQADFELDELSLNGGSVTSPYVSKAITAQYELDGGLVSTKVKTSQYSVYTNPSDSADQFVQMDSSSEAVGYEYNEATEVLSGELLKHTVLYQSYNNRPAMWLMGFATSIHETWERPGETRLVKTALTPYGDTTRVGSRTDYKDEPYEVTTVMSYDGSGNLLSSSRTALVNAASQTRSESTVGGFIGNRYPAKLQNSLAQVEALPRQYDLGLGVLTKSTDANGLSTSYYYDAIGRMESTARSDGAIVTTSLHACEANACDVAGDNAVFYRADTMTHPSSGNTQGTPTTYTYMDVLGREIATEQQAYDTSANIITTTTYNDRGLLVAQTVPHRSGAGSPPASSIEHDALGRVENATEATGQITAIDRASQSAGGTKVTRDVTVSDHLSASEIRRHVTTSNVLGETVSTTEDASQTTGDDRLEIFSEYGYDAQGNHDFTRIDGRTDLETSRVFDKAGRLVSLDDPDTGLTQYQYNGFGELEYESKSNGTSIDPEYDLLGRVVSRTDTYAGPTTELRSWVYDDDSNNACDAALSHHIGALACTFATDFEEHYSYDAYGRLVDTTTRLTSASGQRIYTTSQTYDLFSRVDVQTWPNNFQAQWNYRYTGHLESVDNNATNEELYRVDARDVWGAVKESSLAGGVIAVDAQRDDASGRLASLDALQGATILQQDDYQWWTNGNLGQRTLLTQSNGALVEAFGYDSLNRLESATSSGAITRTESIVYDRIGNIESKYGVAGTYTYSTTQPHAVTSAGGTSYLYDAAGNMTNRGATTVVYNAFNKPVSFSQGGVAVSSFKYGPDQSRFYQSTTQGAAVKETYYVGGGFEEVVTTENSVSTTEGRVYVGDFLLYTSGGAEDFQYLLRDHLGSVSVITDEQGVVLERIMYDPWGSFRTAEGADGGAGPAESDRGFTDHEHLSTLGLIHMNGRVYDPVLGRFGGADPFVQSPYFSQSYNRFAYVMNGPLSFVDPTGKVCVGLSYGSYGGYCHGLDITSQSGRAASEFYRDAADRHGSGLLAVLSGVVLVTTPEFLTWQNAGNIFTAGASYAQVKSGVILARFSPVLGTYLVTDGVSSWMGAVESMSESVHGENPNLGFIHDYAEDGYGIAGEYYFGDERWGHIARSGLNLYAAWRSWGEVVTSVKNSNPDYAAKYLRADGSIDTVRSNMSYEVAERTYMTWRSSDFLIEGTGLGFTLNDLYSDYMGMQAVQNESLSQISISADR